MDIFFWLFQSFAHFLQVLMHVSVSASASQRVGIWLSNSFHAPCKRIQETLRILDSTPWTPDSRYLTPVFVSGNLFLNGIPYFLLCIPDSKAQDSGFRKQQFPGFWNLNSLNGANLLKQERLLNMFIVFEICRVPGQSRLRSGDDGDSDDKENRYKEDFTPF